MARVPFLIDLYPKQARIAGKILLLVGAIMVLAAIFLRSGLARVNADRAAAKLPPVTTYAEAFPHYPTWLVPETVVGFSLAAALVVAGVTLTSLGEKAGRR